MNQLFEGAAIGGMDLRNRFVRSGTARGMAAGTAVSDELIQMYRDLANGGVGLITTGFSHVSRKGQALEKMLSFGEDSDGPGLRRLTGAVHDGGAKIMAQLVHGGSSRVFDPGFPAEAPSAIKNETTQTMPVAMTEADIAQTVRDFASATKRAVENGFDAIQIHAAHYYLLSQFLSPTFNTRTDQYGGPIENRARALFEVYQAVRNAVGSDIPIAVKIHAKEYSDDGLTVEDAAWVCRELSAMGVDAIELHVFGGAEFMGIFSNIDEPGKEAYVEQFAKEIKPQIDCPLILNGGFRSFDVVKRLCEEQTADYFSMASPLVSEPDLVNKWQSGESRIARCISCCKCLFAVLGGGAARCFEFNGESG